MAKTVGDFFIERLHAWGIRRIYGYPGEGINGVFGALQRIADGPVVIEFKTDSEVPLLPSHITLKQAKAFASILAKGDPAEGNVILNTARQLLASVIPGKD